MGRLILKSEKRRSMEVNVYYRGAMNKLHQFVVTDVDEVNEALDLVAAELEYDMFAKKPFLACIQGDK
jgi:hypothetical protein